MNLSKKMTLLFLIAIALSSCAFLHQRPVNRSFYYWKSEFFLTKNDMAMLKALAINRLYIKFFDVTWANQPVPAAEVRFIAHPPKFVSVIPTIYITNETMVNTPTNQIPDLAGKILRKIDRTIKANHLTRIPEMQMDSDWTLQTRDKYFTLLRTIHSRLSAQKILLSATVRLHQVKYRSLTGVPPVDRGILMFYNLAPVNNVNTQNSIIDLRIGKAYTATLDSYPLPLDVALPIFSWGVVFQDDHFICLANDLHQRELIHNPYFERINGSRYFRVKRDVFLHHTQLYREDLVRVEESDGRVINACADYLGAKISGSNRLSVVLFHLDSENLRGRDHAQIASVFDHFH